MKRLFHFFIFLIFLIVLNSCTSEEKPETGPLAGTVGILADPAFAPVLKAEEEIFEDFYKKAELNIEFMPETEAVKLFLLDSTQFIFAGRMLSESEKTLLDPGIPVSEIHFATDAIAFLVHPSLEQVFDLDLLKKILAGEVRTWEQTGKGKGNITLVADLGNSSNLVFLRENLGLEPSRVSLFAAGSNEKVIDYISRNKGSIGIIGSSFIADEEDPVVKERRAKVNIVQVRTDEGKVYSPFQNSISAEDNPLRRKVWLIRRKKSRDAGVGFSSYLMSEKGQRIALKAGLLPAHMPGREIKISKE